MFSGVKVTGDTFKRVPTKAQIKQILDLVDEGLRQGGLGIGIVPGYIVGGLTSQEMIGLQKLAGKYGLFSHVHTRFSSQTVPTSAILAFQEAIASGWCLWRWCNPGAFHCTSTRTNRYGNRICRSIEVFWRTRRT